MMPGILLVSRINFLGRSWIRLVRNELYSIFIPPSLFVETHKRHWLLSSWIIRALNRRWCHHHHYLLAQFHDIPSIYRTEFGCFQGTLYRLEFRKHHWRWSFWEGEGHSTWQILWSRGERCHLVRESCYCTQSLSVKRLGHTQVRQWIGEDEGYAEIWRIHTRRRSGYHTVYRSRR